MAMELQESRAAGGAADDSVELQVVQQTISVRLRVMQQ